MYTEKRVSFLTWGTCAFLLSLFPRFLFLFLLFISLLFPLIISFNQIIVNEREKEILYLNDEIQRKLKENQSRKIMIPCSLVFTLSTRARSKSSFFFCTAVEIKVT